MKQLFLLSAALLLLAGCSSPESGSQAATCPACQPEHRFVSIFNGIDLAGWYGATSLYGVLPEEPGVLQCLPDADAKDEPFGNLLTVKEYGDFILRFEFLMPENGNNGLGVRTPGPEVDAAYYGMCELQLLDDGGPEYYDAAAQKDLLAPYQYCCSPYGIVPAYRSASKDDKTNWRGNGSYLKPLGQWNYEEVTVKGSTIKVVLNGQIVVDTDLAKFNDDGSNTPDHAPHPGLHRTSGHIGFLGHGHNVKWRNIRIMEL